MHIKKNKPGLNWIYPGRLDFTGSTFKQVLFQTRTGFTHRLIVFQVNPPDWSGFQNYEKTTQLWMINNNILYVR